jgi:uncharacterized protein with NAD-binding domain and iron-sulfur cluster
VRDHGCRWMEEGCGEGMSGMSRAYQLTEAPWQGREDEMSVVELEAADRSEGLNLPK